MKLSETFLFHIPSGDAAAAPVESDFEAPVTFLGCMPLPEFLSKLGDIPSTYNDHSRHVCFYSHTVVMAFACFLNENGSRGPH